MGEPVIPKTLSMPTVPRAVEYETAMNDRVKCARKGCAYDHNSPSCPSGFAPDPVDYQLWGEVYQILHWAKQEILNSLVGITSLLAKLDVSNFLPEAVKEAQKILTEQGYVVEVENTHQTRFLSCGILFKLSIPHEMWMRSQNTEDWHDASRLVGEKRR